MPSEMRDVTAIVKTFRREPYFMACVTSLRERHPDITILVADDGPEPSPEKARIIKDVCDGYFTLPFDSGISYARNFLLRKAQTEYVLIGDDDFWYDQDISKLRTLMEVSDLAGGRVKEHGETMDYQGFIEIDRQKEGIVCKDLPLHQFMECDGVRYKPCDFTLNFFIARKSAIPEWDEKIKVVYEHEDFFLSAKPRTHVVFTPDVLVTHKPDFVKLDDPVYREFRYRKSDRIYFMNKWGAKFFQDIHGNIDHL